MAPERDAVREKILKEPHLGADEFHWPLGGRRGYGVVALGKESCLVEIVDSRKTKTIKAVLPGYGGTLTQDSYPAWLHVGSARQMCVVHQQRLVHEGSGVESRRGRGRIPGRAVCRAQKDLPRLARQGSAFKGSVC